MKTFVKLIFGVSFFFFGGGFLITFGQFIIYNGLGDIFEYIPANESTISKERDRMPKRFTYQYSVNGKTFNGYQTVSTEAIDNTDLSAVIVLHNKTFHSFSMLNGIKGEKELSKSNEQIYGMLVFGIPFLFVFLIYKFADIDKWIGVYTRGEYKSSRKN